ncbi:hypothetical protein niasHT_013538 [Heterodera trifolii]|uniref:SH3 domain-containing protein n=1 Tax=Heterodera trifolii TaxID=157864 RepID=A0ABD2LD22_9BILA
MPLLSSSAVGTSPASASSSAASPSARPLRVAQPPPLATAFPSCSSTIPQPPNSVDASSSFLPNSISVPSLPKPTIQFHRSVASVSEIGSRTGTTNKQQNAPGGLNGRGDRGRSRYVQMSYEELLELARNQQRQIEANEDELDERRKAVALFGVAKRTAASQSEQQQNARILMANLRAQISHDELEMVHLGKRQKEAKKLREHNEKQSRELAQLENEYGRDDEQLRRAVAKVDALRRQLEMLYQQRAMAADAAAFQQRQINAEESAEKGSGRLEKRPKASVVPFKVTDWRQGNGEETGGSANGAEFEGGDGQCRGENEGQRRQSPQKSASSLRPPAFQPPINWRRTTPQVDQFSIKRNSMTALKRLSWVAENGGDEYLMNFVVNEQKKGRTHISFGEMVPKPAEGMAEKERIGTNEERGEMESTDNGNDGQMHQNAFKGQRKVIGEGPSGSDQLDIPTLSERPDELREEKQTKEERQTTEKHTKVPFEEEGKTQPKTAEEAKSRADQRDEGVHLVDEGARSRDLEKPKETASKVSSPMKRMAVQENSWEFHKKFAERLPNKMAKDEEEMGTDEKRKEEEEEEEKGSEREEEKEGESVTTEESHQRERRERQSNLNTTPAFEEVLKGRKDQQQLEEEEEKEGEEEKEEGEEEEEEGVWEDKQKEKWVEGRDEESEPKCEEGPREHMAQMPAETEVEEENPAEMFDSPPLDEMTTDESSSSAGEETPIVFEESLLAMPRNVKGILRRSDTVREEKKRRVMFDLIVLFLDVAYEGQYDTLVELAAKIEDISIANSEGTTALHYAICAGNFDIVKFLIENGADVNALDVDGWSPLHCAASCNNPKMLRQLIENGACPFATTFGMSETATQLFDETLDFAVAADYMEMVENCMGMLNDGKVYAAYSYEAEKEDELSFLEGDELRVLRKSEEEGTEGGGERPAGDADGTAPTHFWWLCEHCASEDKGLVPRNYLSLYPTWKFRSRYPTDFEVPRPSRSIAEQIDERTAAAEGCQRERGEISDGQANGREGQRELSTYA